MKLKDRYPLNTFSGETRKEIISLFEGVIKEVLPKYKEREINYHSSYNEGKIDLVEQIKQNAKQLGLNI